MDSVEKRISDKLEAAVLELAFEDTRSVHFDDTVVFGNCYDFDGWQLYRVELRGLKTAFAVWPDKVISKKVWSVYGGPDGGMWFHKFDSERDAKLCAIKAMSQFEPDHPAVVAWDALLASERSREWVKVTPHNPKVGERVLVAYCGAVWTARRETKKLWVLPTGSTDTGITMWQPLPAPPSEGE